MIEKVCPFTQPIIRPVAPEPGEPADAPKTFAATSFNCLEGRCALWADTSCAILRQTDSLEGIKNSLEARASDANLTSGASTDMRNSVNGALEGLGNALEYLRDTIEGFANTPVDVACIRDEVSAMRDEIRRAGGAR